MQTVDIGFGNYLFKARIIGVLSPSSAPMKRLVKQMQEGGKVVDATEGRKKRSVILTDHYVFLSALQCSTLDERIRKVNEGR